MSSLGQHFSQIKLKKRKKISPTRSSGRVIITSINFNSHRIAFIVFSFRLVCCPCYSILFDVPTWATQSSLKFSFLREQKPELLHHQKFLENGTAERAKESGTEQNYNMIDGCVNNNPKKPRIIGNRISVLDRLHIKLEERKQKSQPQQQQERSRKN